MKKFGFMSLLAAALGSAAFQPMNIVDRSFRNATPSRRGKGRIDKSDLPSGYPGAKMTRKAIQRAIAVSHPRGLRTNDIGFAQQ